MSGDIAEDFNQVHKLDIDFEHPDKPIDPAKVDLYKMAAGSITEFIELIKRTKTVDDISVGSAGFRPKITALFKKNDFRHCFTVNKKAAPAFNFDYTFFNVAGGFSRFSVISRTDLAVFGIPFSTKAKSKFEKNSLKFVYSLPIPFNEQKLQFFHKRINRLDGGFAKIGFSYDKLFEHIDLGVFRVWDRNRPGSSQTNIKIKVKYGELTPGEVPSGRLSEYSAQFAPFAIADSTFHLKLIQRIYQSLDSSQFRSNLELFNLFSVSKKKTGEYINRLGYPLDEEFMRRLPIHIMHHFHIKLNLYDIVGLRDFNISAFAFYSYMRKFFEPSLNEFGWGLEKYFSSLDVRLQLAYSLRRNNFQIRVTQD
jgi:hypothetical protein